MSNSLVVREQTYGKHKIYASAVVLPQWKPVSSEAIWSCGCVSAVDRDGRTIWIADAHRDNGKRFVVHADERLTAFLELERVTRESLRFSNA
jgi:hypothetical protein